MKSSLVLCVDDDYAIRDLYQSALATYGHSVLAAGNGHQALQIFQNKHHDIDAAILDYDMPGMNGFELAVRLKSYAPHLPILMISGYYPDLDDMTPFVDITIGKGVPIMSIVGYLRELIDQRDNRQGAMPA